MRINQFTIFNHLWATLFTELAVPVLLSFRRTVYLGLAMGCGFHLFLSQYGGLHGFAAMLFAVYFLFLPREFSKGVAGRFVELMKRVRWPVIRRYGIPVLVGFVPVLVKMFTYFLGLRIIYAGFVIWDVWFLGAVLCFGPELVRLWRFPADFRLRQSWAPLWLIPLVTILNGLSPYVGLKTETSWGMYSNLRTEVIPNHFLIPATFKVFVIRTTSSK